MSQANLAVVHRCLDSFNRGELEPLLSLLDEVVAENAVMTATGRLPDVDGPAIGREAIKDWFRQMLATMDFRTEPVEYVDAGDAVIVVCWQTVRGLESGAEVTGQMVELWGIRDGMVMSLDVYRTKREAREAAGLPPGS